MLGRDITTWKVGGKVNDYEEVSSIDSLKKVIGNNPLVLGNGSNLLFNDDHVKRKVIKLKGDFDNIERIGDEHIVGSGIWMPRLVRHLSKEGFGGLEHCVGIPATLGGLVFMNGGSQRKSISEYLLSVTVMNQDGQCEVIEKDDCLFSYRSSVFKNKNVVIISARFSFPKIRSNENRSELLEILSSRRKKFPRKLPSCGSVFLSTKELFESVGAPGYVIERLGLKGKSIGDAQISPLHANFIVNNGNAKAKEIVSLVQLINEHAFREYGIKLKSEALFVDIEGELTPLDKVSISE
ncbi:UDP-N-acetylmuramate dehydrogenase [Vibrio alginolyticus]|uniref:UDP-N-acetylmuramate dehydrogenase n=1 Tax=Vibrio sp. Vb1729 TaxID=3074644 RepID=UPI002964F128|nr:UDP-N-acetylmuramate dehydrogenase [Vibrio sp. Vb1729]EGQ9111192.1 UDP-N-acetylmuramate dehydrogenase [Vibrio alginolyticus]EJL6749805.1 UDP-N-acetylmuramate dehydrogenase [Vibrio alginolyticus]EMA9138555.1 UDP-N-acetylmuramate dehydrogenase [Vibrio alginolyticus]MDW1896654.1 UDP-N-acetylmuramate dehydrogenase [Vibrio sp. Vb1729]